MYRCTELKRLCTIKNISLLADVSRIIIENIGFGKEKSSGNDESAQFLTKYIIAEKSFCLFCAI